MRVWKEEIGECTEDIEDIISAVTYLLFIIYFRSSMLYCSEIAITQQRFHHRHRKQCPRYHCLVTEMPSPIYLTWILRNFTDSILVKEIMVPKTKTINPY